MNTRKLKRKQKLLVVHMMDSELDRKYNLKNVPDNTLATVDNVDDMGGVHCHYEGYSSSLAILPEDDFKLLTDEQFEQLKKAKEIKI